GARLDLHSFPTRRSSDLALAQARMLRATAGQDDPLYVRQLPQRRRDRFGGRLHTTAELIRGGDRRELAGEHGEEVGTEVFAPRRDRKSTRLNSSHVKISY